MKKAGPIALALLMAVSGGALAQPGQGKGKGPRGVPPGHMPGPGECRVWFDGQPPGQQPAPTDCRTARYEAARSGGRLLVGDPIRGRDRRYDRDRDWGDREWDRDRDWDDREWRRGRDDPNWRRGSAERQVIEGVIEIILRDPELRRWALAGFDTDGNGRLDARERRRAAYAAQEMGLVE